jgi:hypothetical protein
MSKLIICIDFDGVIHDYRRGWQDGSIYGDVVPGFFDWAKEANNYFKLVIYSSRSKTPEGIQAMRDWLQAQYRSACYAAKSWDVTWLNYEPFEFSAVKPPAFVTIDDRGIQFQGNWSAPELSVEAIRAFKPWNDVPETPQ